MSQIAKGEVESFDYFHGSPNQTDLSPNLLKKRYNFILQVFFPTVTACNVNHVVQSFLDSISSSPEDFELFVKEFIEGREDETTEEEKAVINATINSEVFMSKVQLSLRFSKTI